MKNFDVPPLENKRVYYPFPRDDFGWSESLEHRNLGDVVYTTNSNFYLTKTTTYSTEERYQMDIENLKRLKEEKFSTIKVPEYTFDYSDLTIQYTVQYIKGLFPTKRQMEEYYEDLVLRDSEYSFCDYGLVNFILHKGGQMWAIDLTSYCKVSLNHRKYLWKRKEGYRTINN